MVWKWSKNSLEMVVKWSGNGLKKRVLKRSRNGLEMV